MELYKTEGVNRTQTMRFGGVLFTGINPAGVEWYASARPTTPLNQIICSEQRDE